MLSTIPTAGLLTSNTVWLAMDNDKVGPFAWNGPATTSDVQVPFQHFHILNGGPVSTRRVSR